jgi:2,4-dichlorophenol 6-monooxygenase
MVVRDTDVVIVGGGPVGLTASLALSHLGVRHVLLERRRGTPVYPRAIGINQRSMELFRTLGVGDPVAAAAAPMLCQERTAWYTSLDGPTDLHGRMLGSRNSWGSGVYAAEYAAASPCTWRILAQVRLEPILRELAEQSRYADVRFGAEVTGLIQDEESVTVTAREAGGETRVRARYLIGADGGRAVAPALGIGSSGPTDLVDMVSVYFTADLRRYRDPTVLMSWFVNPDHGGSVNTGFLYPVGPWDEAGHSAEHVFVYAANPSDPVHVDEAAALHRIRSTLGIPGFEPILHTVSHWNIQAVVADRFRSGRCFLAGDAAHRMPPWGAMGMNTGLQDVQNLAWKLALCLDHPELAGLLDSYEAERRPVAQSVARNALASFHDAVGVIDAALGIDPGDPAQGWRNMGQLFEVGPEADERREAMRRALHAMDSEFHAHGADCGFFYSAGAFDPDTMTVEADPLLYVPRTLPGHHLPHFWLPAGDGTPSRSTVDLPRLRDFVLLVDSGLQVWRDAVTSSSHVLARRVSLYGLPAAATSPDHAVSWGELREVGPTGALLIRPDGFVAWRWHALPDDPQAALDAALAHLAAGVATRL